MEMLEFVSLLLDNLLLTNSISTPNSFLILSTSKLVNLSALTTIKWCWFSQVDALYLFLFFSYLILAKFKIIISQLSTPIQHNMYFNLIVVDANKQLLSPINVSAQPPMKPYHIYMALRVRQRSMIIWNCHWIVFCQRLRWLVWRWIGLKNNCQLKELKRNSIS